MADTPTIALAAGSTLVAVAFACSLFERWLVRRRPHELAWAAALALFALGALAMWAGGVFGWRGWDFRAFYLLGAVVNVPFLALGTIELLAPRRAPTIRLGVIVLAAFAAGVVLVAPFTAPVHGSSLPQGSHVFGPPPRILAAVCSAGGALVVFAGAAWSVLRTPRRVALGNGLIALGTAILAASGVLNSALGEMQAFSVTLLAGVSVLFAGFLVASAPLRPRRLHVARAAAPSPPAPSAASR